VDPATAAKQDFMPLMRELVRAYQAFVDFDAQAHRAAGVTSSQADVIFTLGNTEGLTFKEIGERTLITKGTLTGVIDRLEKKALVKRVSYPEDRRCTRVMLTPKGARFFERQFPRHVEHLKTRFDRLSDDDRREALAALQKLRAVF
jgi:MarR family 2-MHQ and catechol resistance regulon transcriptional repressor